MSFLLKETWLISFARSAVEREVRRRNGVFKETLTKTQKSPVPLRWIFLLFLYLVGIELKRSLPITQK